MMLPASPGADRPQQCNQGVQMFRSDSGSVYRAWVAWEAQLVSKHPRLASDLYVVVEGTHISPADKRKDWSPMSSPTASKSTKSLPSRGTRGTVARRHSWGPGFSRETCRRRRQEVLTAERPAPDYTSQARPGKARPRGAACRVTSRWECDNIDAAQGRSICFLERLRKGP